MGHSPRHPFGLAFAWAGFCDKRYVLDVQSYFRKMLSWAIHSLVPEPSLLRAGS